MLDSAVMATAQLENTPTSLYRSDCSMYCDKTLGILAGSTIIATEYFMFPPGRLRYHMACRRAAVRRAPPTISSMICATGLTSCTRPDATPME